MKHILLAALVLTSPLMAKNPEATAATNQKTAHSAITPANRLDKGWWKKRHEQKVQAAKNTTCDLLFIGDSITHGWEGNGKKVWDTYYGTRNPFNIGFSGDRTEHVLWRFNHGELADFHPKAAVIMIGTNNTGHSMQKPEETAEGVKAIITQLHKHSPKTQILLLGIFPRGATADDSRRQNNDQINTIIKTYDDGKIVHYLDISSAFLDKDGNLPKSIMPDRLHPNPAGYKLWAQAMEPTLKKLLGE